MSSSPCRGRNFPTNLFLLWCLWAGVYHPSVSTSLIALLFTEPTWGFDASVLREIVQRAGRSLKGLMFVSQQVAELSLTPGLPRKTKKDKLRVNRVCQRVPPGWTCMQPSKYVLIMLQEWRVKPEVRNCNGLSTYDINPILITASCSHNKWGKKTL